jgi:hypothetical protein
MNERIRELMLEAGYAAPEIASRAQKFAELIVWECIDIVDNQGAFMRFNHLAGKIKQHFGVEK